MPVETRTVSRAMNDERVTGQSRIAASARELRRVDDGEQPRNSLVIRAQVRPHVTGMLAIRGGEGTRGAAREKVGARAT